VAEKRPNRTFGAPHDAFWEWCARGELRIQRCGACRELNWPAVAACANCASPDLAWERMSGRGRIASVCTFERDYYGGMLPMPWETILVDLAEGVLFVSNPVGLTWRDLSIGMPVELRFTECEDDAGRFMLPVFAEAERS
jgi:hypothetical protein